MSHAEGLRLGLGMVARLGFRGWTVSDRLDQALRVEPADPCGGGDWNCPEYITPRFTEEELAAAARPLQDRLQALEAEIIRLEAEGFNKREA